MKTRRFFNPVFLFFFVILLFPQICFALTDEEIQKFQSPLKDRTVGERIVFWAEKFIGTPYDQDPMGEYVTKAAIVADERMDCMYLTFRVVELALSRNPEEAIQVALERRFHSKGLLKDGKVLNYENRFEYGEDMVTSGKWGREITSQVGKTKRIKGSRGKPFVDILPSNQIRNRIERVKNGDILFFIKEIEKRKLGEIVGHIGIIKIEQEAYLIHASGTKEKGGEVKKVPLKEYLLKMPFVGIMITRFD
ncbi:MAG: DUF1460 domain-containing protein [Deltaproteobacteria bacterium]|nr:DUF1460 domain-containing protein [Deltaproteobacteria bacterium]